MRIEVTVRGPGDLTRDLAVVGPDRAGFDTFADRLVDGPGLPTGTWWSGDRPLSPAARVGDEGLRTGAVLSVGGPTRTDPRPGVLALHQVGGPQAGRVVPVGRGRLVLGRGTDCDVVLDDPDASRRHAVLDIGSSAITVADCASTNGTRLDGRPVDGVPQPVSPGQHIRIGDSTVSVVGPVDSPATTTACPDGSVRVVRSPRQPSRVRHVEVELPQRPSGGRPRGVQWVTALLPALAGGAIAWLAHSPQFLLFALLSPVMMIGTSLGDRVHWRRSRRREAATYRARVTEAEGALESALAAETAARKAGSPDAAAVLRCATMPGRRLWERRRGDHDAIRVRVGTADLDSVATVRCGSATRPAGRLSAVPVDIDLRDGPLGLCGPPDTVDGVARWLTGQLATMHSPADLQLALLLSPDREAAWSWARWLPHVRGRVATEPRAWTALVSWVQDTIEHRLAARGGTSCAWTGPWCVLIVDRASQLADVPDLAVALRSGHRAGITAICLDDGSEALPSACATVLAVRGVTGTRGAVHDDNGVVHEHVVLDRVDAQWAETVARALAPCVDAGGESLSSVPDACRLLEALDADDLTPQRLLSRWSAADPSGRRAATAIGSGSDGHLSLDLVADGPHALVAGTTGAGKSELLQTLVVGLATNHPPDDVNFLLIDYKGGAAFAECARLPHTAGLVTDLDPYLTSRALRSLDSELRRRERLFAAVGVTDLVGYRAIASTTPLARLVIVVDEFATLADELPDFVRGLVGVAQRGRSLGIHLVLATQRPGSAVSPEIRANTSLRIALRVTDPGESSDVIGVAAAAAIDRAAPGRAFLRTGERLVPFHTAFAGTPAVDARQVVIEELGPWRRRGVAGGDAGATELRDLVATAIAAARSGGFPAAVSPWRAPLPDHLPLDALDTLDTVPGGLSIGLIDLPDEQRRTPLTIDLQTATSVLVAGTSRSGRSTSLAAIALTAAAWYAPDELHLYLLDASGALASALSVLPHCATVLGPDEIESVPTLLRRIARSCGNASALGSSGSRRSGARSLLMIDGWAGVLGALNDLDALDCADRLADLLREGPAAGLTVVLAGDRSVLTHRLSSGFARRILLRQSEHTDFALGGVAPRDVPQHLDPGRGVLAPDGALVQLAHAGATPDLAAARGEAERIAIGAATRAGTDAAIRLRALPRRVALTEVHTDDERWILGVGGDDAALLPFVPFHREAGPARFLVAGPPRSGRSTVLCSLLRQALGRGTDVLVAAGGRSPLAVFARRNRIRVIDPAADAASLRSSPNAPTLLLVDDCEFYVDTGVGEALTEWVRSSGSNVAVAVAGRNDDLATTYRGIGAQIRRNNTGLLLRPAPTDGELLGVRLPRRPSGGPAGRGLVVGDPAWAECYRDGEALPIQVAADLPPVDQPMCG